MMKRTSIATAVIALAALAASPAESACGDRPGTPNNVKVEPAPGKAATVLRVSWTNTASERVWWDVEITDAAGRVTASRTGTGGPVGTKKGSAHILDYTVKSNTNRCFRIRARTGPLSSGCVSEIWSARVCGTTASAPGAPERGKWGALAADGKGAWGYAMHYATEAQARDAARKFCGSGRCMVKVAGPVECYAYVESRKGGYWYGLALHSSRSTALQVARGGCEKSAPAGSCKVIKEGCGP